MLFLYQTYDSHYTYNIITLLYVQVMTSSIVVAVYPYQIRISITINIHYLLVFQTDKLKFYIHLLFYYSRKKYECNIFES